MNMPMLSPGVSVLEVDASGIVPTISNSIAVFGGTFEKGPVGTYGIVTNSVDLEYYYGKPSNTNYNDWYQCKTFLDYGNILLVSRGFSSANKNAIGIAQTVLAAANDANYDTTVSSSNTIMIRNISDFNANEDLIVFPTGVSAGLKFISRAPGDYANTTTVSVATPADFAAGKYVQQGVLLTDIFTYVPRLAINNSLSGYDEFAIIVTHDGVIKEHYVVSLNEAARDESKKSMYIETVINTQSDLIYVKDNTVETQAGIHAIKSYLYGNSDVGAKPIQLTGGVTVATLTEGDIADAYDIFSNKEEIDIDIVIANEANPMAAFNLANNRQDCIAFIGANFKDVVGQTANVAVQNIIKWRVGNTADLPPSGTGLNVNSSFAMVGANYLNVYDKYADKYRWINCAGSLAGLRAVTNTKLASWWASAGLDRGQIKNVNKLAYNPNQALRDLLYKAGLNPVVAFPGQGTVCWGQKTLLDKPSSFDRINVRGLFNTLERALWKMAKYQVFEFNDSFTRNRIQAMINPFLGSVQAGRGIQDYLVVCDNTNNTPDVISRNELVVDVYVKPTFVAEFIQLRFTNAGVNSFASIIGA
jgi:hypothetical protein